MTQKDLAIRRCSAFLADRVRYAIGSNNTSNVTEAAIAELLESEFKWIPEKVLNHIDHSYVRKI